MFTILFCLCIIETEAIEFRNARCLHMTRPTRLQSPALRRFWQSLPCLLPLLVIWLVCCALLIGASVFQFHSITAKENASAERAGSALNAVVQAGRTIAMEASLQPSIIEMLNNPRASAAALKEASAYLQNVIMVQPHISSISICSPERVVLRFPESAYVESEEELFALVQDAPALSPLPRLCASPSGRSRRVLSLIWYSDRQASPACIIVDIDMDSVAQLPALHALYREDAKICLVNDQGQVLFSSDAGQFAQTLSDSSVSEIRALELSDGISAFFFGSQSLLSARTKGLLPIACALLFCTLCLYVIRSVLAPLHQLVVRLDALNGREPLSGTRSFPQQIQSALHNLDSLQKDSREMLAYSLLTKLFTRKRPEDEAFLLHELLRSQVLGSERALYFAVVLRADGVSLQPERTELTQFKLNKAGRLLQWALLPGVQAALVPNDRSMVAGLISVQNGEQPLLKQALRQIAQNFERWKQECDLSFTLGVSYPMEGLQNLRGAYLQALSCTDQRLLLGLGKLISPDVCARQAPIDPSQTRRHVEALAHAILQHDEEACAARLQALLDLLFEGNYSALVLALRELAEKLDALSAHVKLDIGIREALEVQLESMETRRQVEDWCGKWVHLLASAYQRADQTRASVCMEQTLDYIEQHFGQSDLSAQQVADAFHISPQYFSKLFNQEVRCSFPQYLTEKRLLYAYALLSSGDPIHIQEVCRRCGYSSRTYFTASFKKRFGVSPSKVRAPAEKKCGGEK